MKRHCLVLGIVGIALAGSFGVRAGDTDFVAAFDARWRSHNASDVLAFADAQVATKRSVETLFARGLVAAYLQKWGRGAVDYFRQAIAEAQANVNYSEEGRSNVIQWVTEVKAHLEALSDETGEPADSQPTWDANVHAVVFAELGDEAPFLATLDRISRAE